MKRLLESGRTTTKTVGKPNTEAEQPVAAVTSIFFRASFVPRRNRSRPPTTPRKRHSFSYDSRDPMVILRILLFKRLI